VDADKGKGLPPNLSLCSAVEGRVQTRIETKRLILRRATEADLEAYCQRIYCDPEVMRTLPGGKALAMVEACPRASTNLIDYWEQHGFGPWLLVAKQNERLLGHCGLRYWPETQDVEVLYALERPAWGQGYATEAAEASLATGFGQLELERIIAGVLPTNRASIHVLQKLGMQKWDEREFAGLQVVMYEIGRTHFVVRSPNGLQRPSPYRTDSS